MYYLLLFLVSVVMFFFFFFFKQKTAYEMRISDWSSDVCSSDLGGLRHRRHIRSEAVEAFAPAAGMAVAALDRAERSLMEGEPRPAAIRSEEHTSELQSLMRISYAVFCLKQKNIYTLRNHTNTHTST